MEEVYVCLEGAGTLLAGGAEYALEPGVMARVGPGEKRKIVTGDERVRILALGGTPGEAFEPPAFSEETRSDP
jgi:mannose-6-phosphate isomerase-like protein (cupin superfamily)